MEPDLERIRAEMEPPWHDLREQRVLRGVAASRAARVRSRRTKARVAIALAFVAAIALVLRIAVVRSVAPDAAVAAAGSVLTLADGSRLVVAPKADVAIEAESASLVRVAQKAGEVAYDVTPNPARSFEVRAAGVTVCVLGTAFAVSVEPSGAVRVDVTRGKVSVDDGADVVQIGAGERLVRTAIARPSPSSSAASPEVTAPTIDSAVAPSPSTSAAPRVDASSASSEAPTVQELLARADAARGSGRLGEASAALEQLLALYPRDPRAASARFTLARVARAQGQQAKAAMAYRACESGPLGEDALAEEAQSWLAAGRAADARAAASRYLARFPNGAYAARMRSIAE